MSRTATAATRLKFPPGFLWGTATSTTQVEGHVDNEWKGFIARDGGHCAVACDSYHRYAEDIEWMCRLGVNSYRLGLEWSRLQSGPGAPLNQPELSRYLDQLDRLNAAGIVPMVVLHHFSNPPWINARGGWTNSDTPGLFLDYVKKLAPALRNHVRLWNTFNEPETYGCCAYLIGEFPPRQIGRLRAFRTVVRNMAAAHEEACAVLRDAGSNLGPVEVGFSKNWTHFEPYEPAALWDGVVARLTDSQLNHFVLESFHAESGHTAATFLGVNYYGRIRFRNFQPLVPTFGFTRAQLAALGVQCDDMLERHPQGLEPVLAGLHRHTRLPLYLTEHGSSSDDDSFRQRDLVENLAAVHRALSRGVDIRGFYYWSLLDNFEWQFGYSKKFGLLNVDFSHPTLPRRIKPLGDLYRTICLENSFEYNTQLVNGNGVKMSSAPFQDSNKI